MHRLEPGMFLRLERAAGTQLRLLSGQVWITESGQPDDVFLSAGQSYDVVGTGRVVVEPQAATATLIVSREPASVRTRRPSFDGHRAAGS
ncbi:MAG: DUF2917 domain-containing protein [Burkholderiaceae bacterium]|nr:DUF2917 domain-containing protein [Burkholderiaceae bacterium]